MPKPRILDELSRAASAVWPDTWRLPPVENDPHRPILLPRKTPPPPRQPIPFGPDPMQSIRVGDMLAKNGRRSDARAVYRRAAETFEAEGRLAHARGAWRLVLSLDSGDLFARERVAALGLLPAKQDRSTPAIPHEDEEPEEPTVIDRAQRYRTTIGRVKLEKREAPARAAKAPDAVTPKPKRTKRERTPTPMPEVTKRLPDGDGGAMIEEPGDDCGSMFLDIREDSVG